MTKVVCFLKWKLRKESLKKNIVNENFEQNLIKKLCFSFLAKQKLCHKFVGGTNKEKEAFMSVTPKKGALSFPLSQSSMSSYI